MHPHLTTLQREYRIATIMLVIAAAADVIMAIKSAEDSIIYTVVLDNF